VKWGKKKKPDSVNVDTTYLGRLQGGGIGAGGASNRTRGGGLAGPLCDSRNLKKKRKGEGETGPGRSKGGVVVPVPQDEENRGQRRGAGPGHKQKGASGKKGRREWGGGGEKKKKKTKYMVERRQRLRGYWGLLGRRGGHKRPGKTPVGRGSGKKTEGIKVHVERTVLVEKKGVDVLLGQTGGGGGGKVLLRWKKKRGKKKTWSKVSGSSGGSPDGGG